MEIRTQVLSQISANETEIVSEIVRQSFKKQAELLELSEETYPNYVAFEKPQAVAKAMQNGELIYILKEKKKPVGTIRFKVEKIFFKGSISRLAVLPEHRKQGYGKMLMDFAENELKKQGVHQVETSIVKRFEGLQAFYQSLGYSVTKDSTYPSLPFEVRHMEKTL